MRQYFTYVNPYINGAWHPIEYNIEKATGVVWKTLKTNFCVAQGTSVGDARQLGYVEIPVDTKGLADVSSYPGGKYDAAGVMAMILQLFPHVKETVEEAKDKVERWTGRKDITVKDEVVVIPDITVDGN